MGVISQDPMPVLANQPRAYGDALVVAGKVSDRSRIRDLRQTGALKLIFPRSYDNPNLTAVAINTAGGITGGDRFFLNAEVGPDAHLTLTTQAAERAYRAAQGSGHVSTRIRVANGATAYWLPQETILFEGANLRRRLDIDLAADAQLLLVEPLVFGRLAMGETLRRFALDDRIMVRRDGVPAYFDGTRLAAGTALQRPALLAGARAAAQVVMISPRAEAMLPAVRAHLSAQGGASLMAPDMLVMRVLAQDSFELRQSLLPILDLLTENQLPTSWRL